MVPHVAGIMAKHLNRMQFLRGDFNAESPFRPPWSKSEAEFTQLCTRCDECIKACPQNIIARGSAGFPEMSFSQAGCDYCQACADVCQILAIEISPGNQAIPWAQKVRFKDNCLSEHGVVCRACGDVCEMRAIRFKLAVGGIALIDFDNTACNGCGECISLCPVNAIEMQQVEQIQENRI